MDKIICSLEEWDSIIDYHRPNGSSKTWYIKEMKQLSRPFMWGDWNVFTEQGNSVEWSNVYATVQMLSSEWGYQGTDLKYMICTQGIFPSRQ